MLHALERSLILGILLAAGLRAYAAPQLAASPECLGDGELRVRVLARAKGIPPPTPEARFYRLTRGDETRQVRYFRPVDLWRARAELGTWTDAKGNTLRIARVLSLVPVLDREDGDKDEIEKALDGLEAAFTGDKAQLAAWQDAWRAATGLVAGERLGKAVKLRNGRTYYVDLTLAEPVKPQEAKRLLNAIANTLSPRTKSVNSAYSAMKWWHEENDQYRFLTNLDRAKGGTFIKDAMSLMSAMRKAYERCVPPQHGLQKCVVRVFKTRADYQEYRQSTGENDTASCGLWDPSREELLISAENRAQAQSIMRHEAFHQYLHYATGRGDHAMWFNEGHACYFENVKYNAAKGEVKVLCEGNRAAWVARDPGRVARELPAILHMDQAQYYSGDANLHYVAGWALVYFLETAPAAAPHDFARYAKVVPAYLQAMAAGLSADDATDRAFASAGVPPSALSADFLRFWKKRAR